MKKKQSVPASCKHYWLLKGFDNRWIKKHCLIECVHCGSWSVTEFGQTGPCIHVLAKSDIEASRPRKRKRNPAAIFKEFNEQIPLPMDWTVEMIRAMLKREYGDEDN